MSLLELVMIVKNSGDSIIETLQHIKPIISTYTILDTGSTDNTIQNIKTTLRSVPGNIYEEPFVDFSTSRNRSLDLSKGTCKYQIILDDTYNLINNIKLKKLLMKRDEPGFAIKLKDEGGSEYYSYRIIRTKDSIRYKYKVHELLDFGDKQPYIIDESDIHIFDNVTSYMSNRTSSRITSDIKFLKEDLQIYKNDTRILCYLGLLYHKLLQYDTATDYFKKVISNGDNKDWSFAAFSSLYSIYRINNNNIFKLLQNFNYKFCDRAEPLYLLAHYYWTKNEFSKAYDLLLRASKLSLPKTLFPINTEIYTTEIWILLIECAYKLNKLSVVNKLMIKCKGNISNEFRFINMICGMTNYKPLESLTLEKKIIVFCAKSSVKDWSPNHITDKCSGSEIMLINLAKQFVGNYRVFVFGDVIEGNYDGVEYFNCNKLIEFCNRYVIDYYIALRRVNDILYLPNIKRVYLWVHDVDVNRQIYFQYHTEKLKKILCLCDWHKRKIQNTYNIPPNYLSTTFNAVSVDRFNKNIQKTPYRFIYSSDWVRGLDILLGMMPKIKEIFPQTTLYVFASGISDELQKIIDELDYIFLKPRVSQDEIAIEYLKSDVWLYPTHFYETFCITALEAQLARCLCVTVERGSLGEIVGNRGIVVEGDVKDQETIDKIITKLDFVMKNDVVKERLLERGRKWAEKHTIDNLAKSWEDEYFNES